MQPHIGRIIQQDQVAFIPGMQGWVNIHKSVNEIHQGTKMKGENPTAWNLYPPETLT